MSSSPIHISPESTGNYVLLTGATGLVGQYLMRDLLARGTRLAVLVRPKRKQSAESRIHAILEHWEMATGCKLPRPVVLAGDVARPDFGFGDAELQWLKDHCDRMIHNAAILRFHSASRNDEPWLTNLQGTEHALSLTQSCDIRNLHYVSTAYVCGNRNDRIMESDFEDQAGFRNDYEDSKYQAEKRVREASHLDSVTIYRPVVISGDSKTGFTSTYHGLYVYLRLFSMFVPEQERDEHGKILTPVQIPMDGDEPRNIVPVDWVSEVFCEIFENPQAHGQTYHLAPDHCVTPSEVIEACYEYFNSHGVEFCGDEIPEGHQQPEFANTIFDNIAIYQQYESSDPEFDTTNLKKVAGHIPCPPIDKATIIRYMEFGNADQWGKRKPLRVVPGDSSERRA